MSAWIDAWLATGALLVARWLPIVLLVPTFGGLRLVPSVRLGVLLSLVAATWPAQPVAAALDAAALVPQLVFGLAVGALVLAYAEVARIVGALGDHALGRGSFGGVDPVASGASGPLASAFALAWVALVCASGSHLVLLEAIAFTLEAVPLEATPEVAGWARAVAEAVAASLALATALAVPLFALTWAVDAGLGWVGRALPSLSVAFVAMPARSAAGLLVLAALLATVVGASTESLFAALSAR